MRTTIGLMIASALSAQTADPALTPHPYTVFVANTVAQDVALTPKGGWTFIVGSTTDPAYPVTADAFDRTCGTDGTCNQFQGRFGIERQADVVLTVFDASGEIRYSTFLGGNGRDDNPRIALSRQGTIWVAANSTGGAFEHVPPGCIGNLVLLRFEYPLRRVEELQCLSGPTLADLVLDSDGSVWVLGSISAQVPTVNGFQPTVAGQIDMFVARLAPQQAAPIMSTYIGGDRLDLGTALALTPNGDVAIVGSTNSTNFPLVRALRTVSPMTVTFGDAAVLVLDRSGRFLEFSTYWGGAFDDSAQGVAMDAAGNLYVAGTAASSDFPVTAGAFDAVCDGPANPAGCRDAFVTRFTATGAVTASTLFGGTVVDNAFGVAVQPDGEVVLLGLTQSPDIPLVGGQPFQRWRAGVNFAHSFLAVFDPQLTRVTRSIFVGSEQFLPSVPRFTIGGGFAYVTGQVTMTTGPAFGNFLGAVPLP
jgi:hypothetical protein